MKLKKLIFCNARTHKDFRRQKAYYKAKRNCARLGDAVRAIFHRVEKH